jgi:hypothetical protein
VEGPLKGYHHYAFAVRLDLGSPLAGEFRWLRLREPRPGVFWYDMRPFPSEDGLLRRLYGRVPRIPRVAVLQFDGGALTVAAFIEGATLDRVPDAVGRVADRFLDQIEEIFQALAAIDAPPLPHSDPLDCGYQSAAGCTESTAFLRKLVHFSTVHAYSGPLRRMDDLLAELGVKADALSDFGRALPELTYRKPQLLHGDLHRKNFVVDRAGGLWTIDWELALFGDPLYDLATHLHLMGYQPDQERDIVLRWKRAVGAEASAGSDDDLSHYLTYKRLQSVYTDVVRGVARLQEAAGADRGLLRNTAALARKALIAAQDPLGLERVPALAVIEAAFGNWVRTHDELPELTGGGAAQECC